MKKILIGIFTLLFAHIGLAQKGIYQDTHFSFGSNFLSNEKAMTQIHLDLGIGYSFSEKFRLGFILEYGYTSFRDEQNQKARSMSSGMGLSGNFRFYSNEAISLRSETHFVLSSPNRESLSSWFFMRLGTEIQVCFLSLSRSNIQPYIALGSQVMGGFYEKNNIVIERTHLVPYLSLGFIKQF